MHRSTPGLSPSPPPGVHPNSCARSQWCHPAISSSVIPFSCLESFPASGSFLMSHLFASVGHTIEASTAASVLPMNIQDWFLLGSTGLISLQSKGLSRVFSNNTVVLWSLFFRMKSESVSCSIMSDSLQPHGLQHTRLSCPSLSPGVYSDSCPLSWWCHPTISSSVAPFSSHLQSFPASGSFLMSQLFTSGGLSSGASASASVLPMKV